MEMTDLVRAALMYLILPLWLSAGFADYFCHRASHIESTSGIKESLLHLAGFAEMTFPLLAALFLQVDSLVAALMVLGLLLHEATILWDVHYSSSTRHISPLEQHLHGLLELLPWFGFLLIAILHWDAITGIFERGNFTLGPKQPPLPSLYSAGILLAVFVFGLIPFGEEFILCVRHRRR
jgi:hypothetical protein